MNVRIKKVAVLCQCFFVCLTKFDVVAPASFIVMRLVNLFVWALYEVIIINNKKRVSAAVAAMLLLLQHHLSVSDA